MRTVNVILIMLITVVRLFFVKYNYEEMLDMLSDKYPVNKNL